MSRAALCWRSCRLWMSLSGKPKSNELQLSSLEVTKEWTSCSVALYTWCQKFDDLSNHVDLVTTWLTQWANLLLHTEMRVKYYTQIFYMGACRDSWITDFYCVDVKLFQERYWTGDDKVCFVAHLSDWPTLSRCHVDWVTLNLRWKSAGSWSAGSEAW